MPFAKVAAKAMVKPAKINTVKSAFPNPIAAVDAISKFDGPANGIKLKANAVANMIIKSNTDAVDWCLHCSFLRNLGAQTYKYKLTFPIR